MEKQSIFPPVKDIVDDYDDGNIPEVDLPKNAADPLPESERPRKDGTGGDWPLLFFAENQEVSENTDKISIPETYP